MAEELVIYTVIHQPRRLKLPSQPIPRGAGAADIERCLFDERMNERYFRKVARYCYYPATRMFHDLADHGQKLSIGFSVSFLRQAELWDQELLRLFKQLVAHPNVELVGVEPYHNFVLLFDVEMFVKRMNWAFDYLERLFGERPRVTDTTEMCMSDTIYHALDQTGISGAVMDGRGWVMEWREPTHLYHGGGNMQLLTRHLELSDDVGYRFSNRSWSGYPLFAETYAHWLRETGGEFVFIGWDFETFGEHHRLDSGIFEFMHALPRELRKRGVRSLTISEAVAKHRGQSAHLPLPAYPSTWAGTGGMEFFLGNVAQQAIFQLMLHAYNQARLTRDKDLIDLALWLAQSDNLHLIQWFGRYGDEAEVSAYFTPDEWWSLGPNGIIWELQQVYKNFIRALDAHLVRGPRSKARDYKPSAQRLVAARI